jgi:hypothetical protein
MRSDLNFACAICSFHSASGHPAWRIARKKPEFVMANLIMGHGVPGSFGTSLAPSKGFSLSFNGGSETGQPATQLVLPSRRCSILPSSRNRISQRWPSPSVRRRKWLTGSTAFHTGQRSQEARRRCGILKVKGTDPRVLISVWCDRNNSFLDGVI